MYDLILNPKCCKTKICWFVGNPHTPECRMLTEPKYHTVTKNLIHRVVRSLDLNDTTINDGTKPILCKDYLRIVKLSDNDTESSFVELVEIVKKWYIDWCKLSLNRCFSHKVTALQNALQDCEFDNIKDILSFEEVNLIT